MLLHILKINSGTLVRQVTSDLLILARQVTSEFLLASLANGKFIIYCQNKTTHNDTVVDSFQSSSVNNVFRLVIGCQYENTLWAANPRYSHVELSM